VKLENEKLVEIVAKHGVEIENIKDDIDELKDTQKMIYEMNGNIKGLVDKLGNTNNEITELKCDIKKDIKGLRNDIEEVKNKSDKEDAKKWDKLMWLIAGGIITLLIGMIKNSLGL